MVNPRQVSKGCFEEHRDIAYNSLHSEERSKGRKISGSRHETAWTRDAR